MSLVDPDLRWWRRTNVVVPVVWVLRALLVAVAGVAGWSNAQYFAGGVWLRLGGAEILVGVEGVPETVIVVAELSLQAALYVAVACVAADVYAGILRDSGPAWGLPRGVGIGLVGFGAGALAATVTATTAVAAGTGVVSVTVGAVLLLIQPATRLVQRRIRMSRDKTSRTGARTTAVVTKRDVTTLAGRDYWLLTLRFSDSQGRDRWVTHRMPIGRPRLPEVGSHFGIAYDPAHPGRRSSIVVSSPVTPARDGAHRSSGRYRPMRPNGG